MIAIEITLLIIAYTLISITIFLEVICYKKNLESVETITFTISLLLLVVALTASPLLSQYYTAAHTNIFTLLAMVLVGLTTPLNCLEERQHDVNLFWKKVLIFLSGLLFLVVIIGQFIGILNYIQYIVAFFLGISVLLSMVLVRTTKPKKRIVYKEHTEQIFAIAFIVFLTLHLIVSYTFESNIHHLTGFSIPILFILLAGSKSWDELQRLSLLNTAIEPREQQFKNFALTNREKEVAIILSKGITYKQISEELHISMPTVKTHASNIYKKCGVSNKTELTMLLISK